MTKQRCQNLAAENKLFKDIHREKTLLNKIPALAKIMNTDTCVVGTSNQLFIKGS